MRSAGFDLHVGEHAVVIARADRVGAATLTPEGRDVALIRLTGDTPDTVAGVITGTGDVNVDAVAVRGGELVVSGDYTGELRIGAFTDMRADQSGFVLATEPP